MFYKTDDVLVVNSGSGTVKITAGRANGTITLAKDGEDEYATGYKLVVKKDDTRKKMWQRSDAVSRADAISEVLHILTEAGFRFKSCGHRVVHGGTYFDRPTRVTAEVLARIDELASLAPLHNPPAADGIRAIRATYPDVPNVAVFDTAHNRNAPREERCYALGSTVLERIGDVERFGFHGIAYESMSAQLHCFVPEPENGDTAVLCQWGSGASINIVVYNAGARQWKSVYCSLGAGTTGERMLMATRSPLDADITYLIAKAYGDETPNILTRHGGLLAASEGLSEDMEVLLASDDPRAARAINMWLLHARSALGAVMFRYNRPKVIVLGGGVGEYAVELREPLFFGFAPLVILDPDMVRFTPGKKDAEVISAVGSMVKVVVMHTDENRMIAEHTVQLLNSELLATAAE